MTMENNNLSVYNGPEIVKMYEYLKAFRRSYQYTDSSDNVNPQPTDSKLSNPVYLQVLHVLQQHPQLGYIRELNVTKYGTTKLC